MPSSMPPTASSTACTGTPVKITQPAAPTVHCVPLGLWGNHARPLPEHCSTIGTAFRPSVLSSATVKLRGFLTPLTSIFQPSGSFMMSAEGGVRLLRTNRRSEGVITPEPKAVRFVSMVLALCTMTLSAFFQSVYGGSGFASAAAAVPAALARAMLPSPARATTPPVVANMRRRPILLTSSMGSPPIPTSTPLDCGAPYRARHPSRCHAHYIYCLNKVISMRYKLPNQAHNVQLIFFLPCPRNIHPLRRPSCKNPLSKVLRHRPYKPRLRPDSAR